MSRILRNIWQRVVGSELLRAGFGSLGVSIGGMLANLLLVNVINRFYGSYELGVYTVFLHLLNLAGIFSLMGMSQLGLREIAANFRNGNLERCYQIIKSQGFYILLSSCLVTGILLALNQEDITARIFDKPNLPPYLFKSIICIPGFALARLASEILRGFGKIIAFTLLNNVVIYVLMLIGSVMLIQQGSIDLVLNIYVIFTYGLLILQIFLISMHLSFWKILQAKLIPIGSLFKESRAFFLNSVLFQLQPSIGVFILTREASLVDVGYYDVILKISNLAMMALTAFNAYTAPKFAELFPRKDFEGIQKVIYQANFPMYSMTIPVFVLIILFPSFCLGLFDVHSASAAIGLMLLGFAQTVNTVASSVGWFLNMTGNQDKYLRLLSLSILANLVVSYLLVMQFGIIGVCIGTAFGIIFINLSAHWYIRKNFGINTILGPGRYLEMVKNALKA